MCIRFSIATLTLLMTATSVDGVVGRQAASGVTIDVESIRALLVTGLENNVCAH